MESRCTRKTPPSRLTRLPHLLFLDSSDRDDEALVIRRRELYVGMTRARDGLWVGVCA